MVANLAVPFVPLRILPVREVADQRQRAETRAGRQSLWNVMRSQLDLSVSRLFGVR